MHALARSRASSSSCYTTIIILPQFSYHELFVVFKDESLCVRLMCYSCLCWCLYNDMINMKGMLCTDGWCWPGHPAVGDGAASASGAADEEWGCAWRGRGRRGPRPGGWWGRRCRVLMERWTRHPVLLLLRGNPASQRTSYKEKQSRARINLVSSPILIKLLGSMLTCVFV